MTPKTRGGRRRGAGRKRTSRLVMHRRRPPHALRYPSHVTITFERGLGSLRQQRIYETLREIFRHPNVAGFHVCQFSIQTDHVHLVVEAVHRKAFSSGMRSLSIRCGLRINDLFGRRRGKVIRDRYHRRDLFTASQVRRVLRYVLLNGHKHDVVAEGALDPFSSASSFDGWLVLYTLDENGHPRATGDPLPTLPPARPVPPWTKLLAEDWRDEGLISPWEGLKWQRRAGRLLSRREPCAPRVTRLRDHAPAPSSRGARGDSGARWASLRRRPTDKDHPRVGHPRARA